ncbi:MAG: tRNA epoxyqueuosine(34) reductase QueG [Isosphaeraceae bacterium]
MNSPAPPDSGALSDLLKREATRLGFDLVGIAPAVAPPGYEQYQRWLSKGYAAGMGYLERLEAARSHPRHVMDGVRSIVVVGFVYGGPDLGQEGPTTGKVARYARGQDYHKLLWDRLGELLNWLQGECPGLLGRAVSDTSPLPERDFGRLAGLGWIGKNTMLISRKVGSFTLLGALLVDAELPPDPPMEANHCGTCTRCLDACPTDAFARPYELDARRCISYWTIEHKGPIPDEVAGNLHGWAFGCDICQEVCPWNRKAPKGREPALSARPEWDHPDLLTWLIEEPATLSKRLKGTALSRTKRSGLVRNAALILGTRRELSAVPALIDCLCDDDSTVRGASAWALGQIGNDAAALALRAASDDPDPSVVDAVARALGRIGDDRNDTS